MLYSGFGAFWIIVFGVGAGVIHVCLLSAQFSKSMKNVGGYHILPRAGFNLYRLFYKVAILDRTVGAVWFTQRLYYSVLVAGVVMAASAVLRSWRTGHSLEFARSGSLLVILGLVAIVIGIFESKALKDQWSNVHTRFGRFVLNDEVAGVVSRDVESGQFKSAWYSFIISVIGTIVWAYGDQIIACTAFAWRMKTDLSNTICPGL